MKAFQTDVTLENCFTEIECPVDVATLIFVLSAIHPDKFQKYVNYLNKGLKNSNIVKVVVIYCLNYFVFFLELLKTCTMLLVAEEYYFFEIMGYMIWHSYVLSLDTR